MDYFGTKVLAGIIHFLAALFAVAAVISGFAHLLDGIALNQWAGMVPAVAAATTAIVLFGVGRALQLLARLAAALPMPDHVQPTTSEIIPQPTH